MRAKGNSIIIARVIIPPLTSTGCGVTYNEEEGTLPKMCFVIFEFDREIETIPLRLWERADEIANCLALVGPY